METIITKSQVADAVYAAIPRLACELPADIAAGLEAARAAEDNPRGRAVLDQLVENARIAREDRVPICRDTGTVWVSLEIGPGVLADGDVFADVDDAVARATTRRLRKSVVRDAVLDRANTGDNTPAFCDIHPVDEPGAAQLHIMLKGGGSDNASRVVMLVPGAGKQGASWTSSCAACARRAPTPARRSWWASASAPRSTRWPASRSGRSCVRWTSPRPTRECERWKRSCSRR